MINTIKEHPISTFGVSSIITAKLVRRSRWYQYEVCELGLAKAILESDRAKNPLSNSKHRLQDYISNRTMLFKSVGRLSSLPLLPIFLGIAAVHLDKKYFS